ncbi:uncharacterized protein N7496_002636 [Penicillium cataractarum]|uniref:Altered inheritance of mitochondria protein 9, mitochondrial n=1 Tax=Penicillium cataractarum TaxID=2100454 RepID=A0A9W9SKF3_9EURO|nr:uncharacterized protein N7496_002636 [Penicillium cataractarum]KAJ5380208.1 hypothetical protein N7496_002636 [Penicillium cataractarum]
MLATGPSIIEGPRITKCVEGLHNKAFILKMDNGPEAFAKLPNPNARPARFSVASEVATRELLRDVFKIPVPRVLSWSSNAGNNPVEAEDIIKEKATGVRLGSVWNQWPRDIKLQLITQVVAIENELTNINFDKHGCIYFKQDLRTLIGEAEDIHTQTAGSNVLERFSIRPLTTNELWRGARRDMNLDCGSYRWANYQIPIPLFLTFLPGTNACEYTHTIGHNEWMWVKAHAVPRLNYYRPNRSKELPEDGVLLLEKYMNIFPLSCPQPSDESSSANVLWYPDLHLDNIFVDPDTCQITHIVD